MVFEESKNSCDYSSSQTENDSLQSQTQMKDNDEVEEDNEINADLGSF